MSRALVNDGVPAFVVLLVLLLAMSLVAVIRLPRRVGSPSDENTQDEPGRPPPSHARHTRAGTGRPETQAGAPSGPARHVTGPAPGPGTAAAPKPSGSPPWGPAPKPPGQAGS